MGTQKKKERWISVLISPIPEPSQVRVVTEVRKRVIPPNNVKVESIIHLFKEAKTVSMEDGRTIRYRNAYDIEGSRPDLVDWAEFEVRLSFPDASEDDILIGYYED